LEAWVLNSLLTAFEFALDTERERERERSESVAFSGALSLLLLLLCMELLLQFGARISTSQMVSSTTRLGGLSFENMLKEKARR